MDEHRLLVKFAFGAAWLYDTAAMERFWRTSKLGPRTKANVFTVFYLSTCIARPNRKISRNLARDLTALHSAAIPFREHPTSKLCNQYQ
jgi:hypothetical protein